MVCTDTDCWCHQAQAYQPRPYEPDYAWDSLEHITTAYYQEETAKVERKIKEIKGHPKFSLKLKYQNWYNHWLVEKGFNRFKNQKETRKGSGLLVLIHIQGAVAINVRERPHIHLLYWCKKFMVGNNRPVDCTRSMISISLIKVQWKTNWSISGQLLVTKNGYLWRLWNIQFLVLFRSKPPSAWGGYAPLYHSTCSLSDETRSW